MVVWWKADARDAATFVEKFDSDELKAQLATVQIGPKA